MRSKRLSRVLALLSLVASGFGLPEANSAEAEALHYHLHARAANKNGSTPLYKNPTANIEDRVNDLLLRMTVEEKVAQM